jgi:hypothetical protein
MQFEEEKKERKTILQRVHTIYKKVLERLPYRINAYIEANTTPVTDFNNKEKDILNFTRGNKDTIAKVGIN